MFNTIGKICKYPPQIQTILPNGEAMKRSKDTHYLIGEIIAVYLQPYFVGFDLGFQSLIKKIFPI